jgi:plasmid stabilization system protein ParE
LLHGGLRTDPLRQAPYESIVGALAILVLQPGIGEKVETGRPTQVRRFRTDKTERWIYYRVKGPILEVLSVWGTARGSGPKL